MRPETVDHQTGTLGNRRAEKSILHPTAAANHRNFHQFVYLIPEENKGALVIKIVRLNKASHAIVYVRTNFAADRLAESLNRAGITAESFHDNKSQRTKTRSLENFRNNSTNVLVATESAASVLSTTHVATLINYDLPLSAETYIERMRSHGNPAADPAKAFSFCNKSEERHLSNLNRALVGEIEILDT